MTVCLFVRLLVRLFVSSFVHWLVGSFVCLFVCPFVGSFVCLFVCLFIRWFVCLFVCSFVSVPRLVPEGYPMLGEKVARAAVSPHLYIHTYIHDTFTGAVLTRHSGSYTPTDLRG